GSNVETRTRGKPRHKRCVGSYLSCANCPRSWCLPAYTHVFSGYTRVLSRDLTSEASCPNTCRGVKPSGPTTFLPTTLSPTACWPVAPCECGSARTRGVAAGRWIKTRSEERAEQSTGGGGAAGWAAGSPDPDASETQTSAGSPEPETYPATN